MFDLLSLFLVYLYLWGVKRLNFLLWSYMSSCLMFDLGKVVLNLANNFVHFRLRSMCYHTCHIIWYAFSCNK